MRFSLDAKTPRWVIETDPELTAAIFSGLLIAARNERGVSWPDMSFEDGKIFVPYPPAEIRSSPSEEFVECIERLIKQVDEELETFKPAAETAKKPTTKSKTKTLKPGTKSSIELVVDSTVPQARKTPRISD